VEPWEYKLYHGGFHAQSGLSYHVHCYDFLLSNPQSTEYEPISNRMYQFFEKYWRGLCTADRVKTFHENYGLKDTSFLRPLGELRRLLAGTKSPVALNVYGPFTPVPELFVDPETAERVCLVNAMGLVYHGEGNLLGGNFNQAVDPERFQASLPLFPNAAWVFTTSETCKCEDKRFAPSAKLIALLPAENKQARDAVAGSVAAWTDRQRGQTQPLFDAVAEAFTLEDKVDLLGVVPVDIAQPDGVRYIAQPTGPRLTLDSPMEPGFYATMMQEHHLPNAGRIFLHRLTEAFA